MFAAGLVQETRGLVERYGEGCPLLDTIGYSEARAVLRGHLSEAEAINQTTRRTQQFAKRQRTWFRRQHQPLWLTGDGAITDTGSDPLQVALSAIERVLG
jgi:tRNA dimethylallyltransferase